MTWRKVKLGKLLAESTILSTKPCPTRRIRVRLNVAGVEQRPVGNDKKGATTYYVRKKGQFIYGKQNFHKGAFGIIPEALDGFESSADIPSFDIRDDCLPEWIYYFFKQGNRYLQLNSLARGVGSKRIHPKQIADIEIDLPSYDIQKHLISLAHQSEKTISDLCDEIEKQTVILSKYRQAIIKEAIEGKLTADWREENPDTEPANDLLNRIATEKKELVKRKKIKKQKVIQEILPEEIPFDIPDTWQWCRLGTVCYGFQYGTSSKSKKHGQVPVLRMGNIQDGAIVWDNLVYSDDLEEIEKFKLFPGDLLFNRTNSRELVGKTGLYHGDRQSIYAGYLVRFHMAGKIVSDYANAVMNSPLHTKWCLQVKSDAIGQSNINATKLSYFTFPLPPLSEQAEIVRRMEAKFKLCDTLKAKIQATKQQIKNLNAAILHELFKVPDTEKVGLQNQSKDNQISLGGIFEEISQDYATDTAVGLMTLEHYLSQNKDIREFHQQKIAYIAKRIYKLNIHSNFTAKAAGPWSGDFRDNVSYLAEREKWYHYKEASDKAGKAVIAGNKFGEGVEWAKKQLGTDYALLKELLAGFNRFGDAGLERWATILMVVEQLENDNKSVTARAIQKGIDNWPGKRDKKWFSRQDVEKTVAGLIKRGWIKQ